MVRAVRGATTVSENSRESILNGTMEMLDIIIKENNIPKEDIISAYFTVTRDLDEAFPAEAARLLGWSDIPLMCSNEIDVKGSLGKCVRVMIHLNCPDGDKNIKHIYLNDAKKLRPDLIK